MHKAYKYRFYPTTEQEQLLRRTIGCCRYVYNRALAVRQEAYTQHQEKLTYSDLSKMLTGWKKEEETEWLSEVPSVPLQQAVRNLEVAYQNFFAKRAAYPKFKKKGGGGSFRLSSNAFTIRDGQVRVAKSKVPLDIRWSRPLPEGVKPSQCTVKLTSSGRWYISFLCDVPMKPLPPSDKSVGLDMGITALVTTSDGERVVNPKHLRKQYKKLTKQQKCLARKQKGSANYRKARLKLSCTHERIADSRKDLLHKLSTRLVRENQSIAIEDLSVRNMMKCHNLAGSIGDAGWYTLRWMLEYKCRWYGRELQVVDRWFPSSKTCSSCGHVVDKLPLNIRSWTCPACQAEHDRDVNAAINILSAGTVDYTCGGARRPKRAKHVDACPVETGISYA